MPEVAQAGGLSGVPSGQRSPAVHAPAADDALRSMVLPAGNPAKRQKTGVTGSSGPLGVPIKAVFETSGRLHDTELDALRVRCLSMHSHLLQAMIPCFNAVYRWWKRGTRWTDLS